MTDPDLFSFDTVTKFTPFWRKFPSFFLYPMQFGSIIRIAGFSVASGIFKSILNAFGGTPTFIPNTFGSIPMVLPDNWGAWPIIIIWVVFLKYAFEVMDRTSNGQFDEPDGVNDNGGYAIQVLRQFVLIVIILLLMALLTISFGDVGNKLGWLLMNVAAPACIMIIAVRRNLSAALNPTLILSYIRTIGSPYLALCFIILSLTGSGYWLQSFLHAHMDSWLLLPLTSFVRLYFVLIAYHMMGYVIYQYHEELGIHATVSFDDAQAKISPSKGDDLVLTRLNSLIADGHFKAATDLLHDELVLRWENNDLHERYQKLLLAAGKQILAMHHAREFINKLVNEKRLFQALDLYEKWLEIDPEFKLQDSYQVLELASAANVAKRQQFALYLMQDFDKKYPGHPHIPSVYLLSAQILSEHYQKNKEAIQILHLLQTEFPDHTLASEARRYIEVLSTPSASI